ncbi:unnamed protein product [Didymodactylos carnosus]|uniref:Uncharacterized protein n=1 Tax=Didymodactylos carnosus TaxID=1234261 RepID=A0A815SQH9_9BILA|nr:unnamed protein product [Didymodactylos carnosus]CAF1493892.1 unnamed protein product [Didymodactylos carnosus]CAF3820243.1 unnamed protein product [Didymodactylos carnosus]CAF4356618.1 unnamed protein product [Didymodactylos carnosus]
MFTFCVRCASSKQSVNDYAADADESTTVMQHESNQFVFIQREEDPNMKSQSLDTIKSLPPPLKTQSKSISIKRQPSKKSRKDKTKASASAINRHSRCGI